MYKLTITTLFIFTINVLVSQTLPVKGYVYDRTTGESMIGAHIFHKATGQGAVTNHFGYFSMKIPKNDTPVLRISYVGYETYTVNLDTVQRDILKITLRPVTTLTEVVIKDRQINKTNSVKLSKRAIELSKSFSGESDVMKTYQLVAGVSAGAEGSNELIVRGGAADQNLVLMDDVPLYYVNHIGGFVSVFNEDAIKNSTLIKGGFPARYGGRLSSVLDVRMNDGSLKKWGGAITLGLISSKLHVEGPLIKDKSSIMISGRRSIYDLLMKPISESATGGSNSIALPFYDLNLKANYIFSDRDRIYLSAYTGRDQFISHMKGESDHTDLSYKMEANNEIKWGNSLGRTALEPCF